MVNTFLPIFERIYAMMAAFPLFENKLFPFAIQFSEIKFRIVERMLRKLTLPI